MAPPAPWSEWTERLRQVEFIRGELADLEFKDTFDALIGRFINVVRLFGDFRLIVKATGLFHRSRDKPRRDNMINTLSTSVAGAARSQQIYIPALLRQRMIVEMTYLIARKRGYAPGYETRDWVEAERVIAKRFPEE